jgi:LacI family transcriptional regulator
MNIENIAKIAKVSSATVSRVINNADSVKIDTKLRVLAIIRELDFRPNPIAQSLARRNRLKSIF